MSSILADIETTISEGTYKVWFPKFLEILDKENIKSGYVLVYKSFTKDEFLSRPYDFPDMGVWDWLLNERLIEYDVHQENSEPESIKDYFDNDWRYEYIVKSKNYLYTFTNKFFDCYQKYALRGVKNDLSYWFYEQSFEPNVNSLYSSYTSNKRYNYRYYFNGENEEFDFLPSNHSYNGMTFKVY